MNFLPPREGAVRSYTVAGTSWGRMLVIKHLPLRCRQGGSILSALQSYFAYNLSIFSLNPGSPLKRLRYVSGSMASIACLP